MADYYPKDEERAERQEAERPAPEEEHRRQPPNRVPYRPEREQDRGEWPGVPYRRGYAEEHAQVDRYGYVDQRRRYGRRGDWEGWSEPGYDRERDEDLSPAYRPDWDDRWEDEDWSYEQPWMVPGPMSGLGPRGYRRSDENIFTDVVERLTRHGQLDAREIEVAVEDGEVTLRGTVDSRRAKRMAEDTADSVPGVFDVHNRLIIRRTRTAPLSPGPGQGQAGHERAGPGGEGFADEGFASEVGFEDEVGPE